MLDQRSWVVVDEQFVQDEGYDELHEALAWCSRRHATKATPPSSGTDVETDHDQILPNKTPNSPQAMPGEAPLLEIGFEGARGHLMLNSDYSYVDLVQAVEGLSPEDRRSNTRAKSVLRRTRGIFATPISDLLWLTLHWIRNFNGHLTPSP